MINSKNWKKKVKINKLYKITFDDINEDGPSILKKYSPGKPIHESASESFSLESSPDYFLVLEIIEYKKEDQELILKILYNNRVGYIDVDFELGDALELVE